MTHPVPLTERKSSATLDLWAQREYAVAYSLGVAFTAHDVYWHYRPADGSCLTLRMGLDGERDRAEWSCDSMSDWTHEARVVARRLSARGEA